MGKTKVYLLLDELERKVDGHPRLPLTDRVVVDAEEVMAIIEEIREAVKEMEEGPSLRTVAGGAGSGWAERLLEEAQERAKELRMGAVEYADKTLEALASSLQKTLQVIEKGRLELKKEKEEIMNGSSSRTA